MKEFLWLKFVHSDFPKEQTELYELQSSPYERGCSYDISSSYFFVQVKSGVCYITGHWG